MIEEQLQSVETNQQIDKISFGGWAMLIWLAMTTLVLVYKLIV